MLSWLLQMVPRPPETHRPREADGAEPQPLTESEAGTRDESKQEAAEAEAALSSESRKGASEGPGPAFPAAVGEEEEEAAAEDATAPAKREEAESAHQWAADDQPPPLSQTRGGGVGASVGRGRPAPTAEPPLKESFFFLQEADVGETTRKESRPRRLEPAPKDADGMARGDEAEVRRGTPPMEKMEKDAGEALLAHVEERLRRRRPEAARAAEDAAEKAAREAVRRLLPERCASFEPAAQP
ncbi:uncharacterized protein CG45076-like [Hippocampus comes]|uniref:uncharacterized protein CG45076-like n=1 Tax=Hippocampus comes TaxID=109280 RepID=UPI00094EFDA8|nr:PREDICTED: uncharacterized protein CG45076-like [Hippocampus comes]